MEGIKEKIFAHYEKMNTDWERPHLGASIIGHPCERYLWLSFRWAKSTDFDGRMLRLFDTGSREEARIICDLRNIGIEVSGTQNKYIVSPHFGGSCDGIGKEDGIEYILEFKTHNEKSFLKLEKEGVQKSKPQHYAQMQVYMGASEIKKALYFAVNKNTDDIYTEIVDFDENFYMSLCKKAERVIYSKDIPSREICTDCKWCNFKKLCDREEFMPEKNCRTCIHSTPRDDGKWFCEHDGFELYLVEQKEFCTDHLFHPGMIPQEIVESDGKTFIQYETFRNEIS